MNPNDPQFAPQPEQPASSPVPPQQQAAPQYVPAQPAYQPEPADPIPAQTTPRASKRTLIWGLVLLIAPTVLIIASFVLFAIASSLPTSPAASGSLFNDPSPAARILNIIGMLASAIGGIAWLPGVVIGIVLLVKRKK